MPSVNAPSDLVVELNVDAAALAARNAAAETELVLRVEHHCAFGLDLLREIKKAEAALAVDFEIFNKRACSAKWDAAIEPEYNALEARKQALRNAEHAIKTCGQGVRF